MTCRFNEWMEIDRVIRRQTDQEPGIQRTSTEERISNEPDTGSMILLIPFSHISLSFEYLVWKDLLSDDIPHPINDNRSSITPEMNIEHMLHTSDKDLPVMKEEILGNSSPTSVPLELVSPTSIPASPPDNRRTSIRQQKRRIFPTPKDSSNVLKKRLRLEFDNNSNFNLDSIPHSDHSSIFNEQQSIESKTIHRETEKRILLRLQINDVEQ